MSAEFLSGHRSKLNFVTGNAFPNHNLSLTEYETNHFSKSFRHCGVESWSGVSEWHPGVVSRFGIS